MPDMAGETDWCSVRLGRSPGQHKSASIGFIAADLRGPRVQWSLYGHILEILGINSPKFVLMLSNEFCNIKRVILCSAINK